MPRTRVAILAGGRSSEHDISLASARSVLESLDPERYDVVTVAIGRDGRWELGAGDDGSIAETLPVPAANAPATLGAVDVVLPILHGPFGEDGTVQGLLELAGVPYVGAGVAASALCMDKDLFKKVLRDSGLPVARHVALREGDPVQNPFGFPCFVKPARLGSSVGITKAHDEGELAEAVLLAFRHDDKVLVEEFLDGIEVEVGVLGNREPIASIPGPDRPARTRVVRLLVEVRRGRHGPRHPARPPRQRGRSRCSGSRSSRFASRSARGWPASTASSSTATRSSSTS